MLTGKGIRGEGKQKETLKTLAMYAFVLLASILCCLGCPSLSWAFPTVYSLRFRLRLRLVAKCLHLVGSAQEAGS